MEIAQITPNEGWVEQDSIEILETVRICVREACGKLSSLGNLNKLINDNKKIH